MQITNEKLYALCKKYGSAAKLWRQKFIGLLPEVNKRRLYEKKGFSSIFEFAAKLCGLSAEQVRLALNLEKRLEDKPTLKRMLESGEASIHKLTRVVSIATPDNEEELAEKVKILPKSALDTFVRDVKYGAIQGGHNAENTEKAIGSQKPFFGDKRLPGQTLAFALAEDVQEELNDLHSRGIDVNEFLRKALKERRAQIEKTKEEIAGTIEPTKSRYIPIQIKRILQEEHGEKCAIATCKKLAQTIHHTQRFSLSQNHDPRFLAPLCREHHIIAHSIDRNYHRMRATSL